ncbi:cell division protein FtsQ/DivIB [Zhouia sp. PK063]|uniref:cell division protein FtsQ/DivIB n=1 Tax=Zhouia sp. PK063 TaxID=3373602 RepID=UPI0037A14B4F
MKINWNYIKVILSFVVVLCLFSFSAHRNEQRKLAKVNVHFTNGNKLFITQQTVNNLLIQNQDSVTSIAKEKLVLNRLEHTLRLNEMIEDAQVYLSVDGQLSANIRQRTPIARVWAGTSYYIDTEGSPMPMSSVHSARVPLIVGDVNKKDLASTYKVANYIYNDEFLKTNVIGIRQNQGQFQLKLRTNDFTVDLGYAKNLHKKFSNFMAFYKKAQKDNSLNDYSRVALEFNNQVVCTKK